MLQRWRPFFLVSLLAPLVSCAASFENSAIVRTVELGGSLVHVTTTYAVKALEAKADTYTFAIGPNEKKKTSWQEAKVKGSRDVLTLKERGYDVHSDAYLLDVTLPKTLKVNESLTLVFETVQTHATYPWPQRAAQNEDQSLKYETGLFVISPYPTTVQRTKIRSPSPKIISHTEPKGLDSFIKDSAVTKSGSTITYGPFHNIPTSATPQFVGEHQKPLTIHYNYDHPILEVTDLRRSAEISHWGANLNIQDDITLHNAGPTLKGHFSRLEHQTQNFYQRASPHVFQGFGLTLPAGIRNAYYYDLIGNVSTSKLRAAPSVSRKGAANVYSVMEMKPRYPLLGGWNYSFTMGWDAPLADSASFDEKNGRYIVGVPIMTVIPGAVVDKAEVKVVFPEGATDVEFFPPFPARKNEISTHVSYLDTTGRPALTLHYEQLTDKHAGIIYVSYKVPLAAHLKKPFAVASAFMGLFVVGLFFRRIDFTVNKK